MHKSKPISKDNTFDLQRLRTLFPTLNQRVYNKPLIYFDNAATTHKPFAVIDCAKTFYQQNNANVHRGIHALTNRSTYAIEQTRQAVQKFIHAPEAENIIFTSGTTESLNLVAATYGQMVIQPGDEIIVSCMEHHANFIAWQLLCKSKNAYLKSIPIDHQGQLDLDKLNQWITPKTKIVALCYVSNTLGTINPIKEIITKAHEQGAVVVIDGAQAVAHLPVDVMDLDCDFFAFSAHKMYGLTGFGCLYGKKKWLEMMPPYQTGGGMVKQATLQDVIFQDPPYKFEAGTLPIASIVSFRETLKFLDSINCAQRFNHEERLTHYALSALEKMPQVKLIGKTKNRIGLISFNITNMHHLDVGLLLDAKGIAVRTGHCCAQPLMQYLNIDGLVRISFACYNTIQEIDHFLETLQKIIYKNK